MAERSGRYLLESAGPRYNARDRAERAQQESLVMEMKRPRAMLGMGFVIGAVILAGCASSNKQAVATRESSYFGPPIKLKTADNGSATQSQSPLGTDIALTYFNARRAEVGLPAMAFDANIALAASEHANYLLRNNAHGHDEVAGAPGFTGIDATSRVRRHTDVYGASEVLSVFNSHRPAEDAIEQIFASPYHRSTIFFDWVRAGAAAQTAATSVTVVDFADIGHALADNELVAYPYDRQADAPVVWTDNEVPDPMGAGSAYRGRDVGYPITLSGGPTAHIELDTFELRNAKGRVFPCHIAALTSADTGRNTAVCTPMEPLQPGTRYLVHAVGRLTQATRFANAPFALDWSFTTRASHAVLAADKAGVYSNDM
jgi:uncharacterized protein YkwD